MMDMDRDHGPRTMDGPRTKAQGLRTVATRKQSDANLDALMSRTAFALTLLVLIMGASALG